MNDILSAILLVSSVVVPISTPTVSLVSSVVETTPVPTPTQRKILAKATLNLDKRNPDSGVNEIFRDNILLNLHYIKGDAEHLGCHPESPTGDEGSQGDSSPDKTGFRMMCVDWEKVREPFEFSLTLEPGQLLAFHDEFLPEFEKYRKKALTGWTKFSVDEGYKVLDGLSGNGVCHLATLINWAANEASLQVTAKVNHDFLPVPDVDRKYGTSIVYLPGATTTKMQNLYIINNTGSKVEFVFKVDYNRVELSILKIL